MAKQKDIVVGLGEIGMPIFKLISKSNLVVGYDINQKLMNMKKFSKYENTQTRFLHVCIPFTKNFVSTIKLLYKQFSPQGIIVHSTIKPHTTESLQKQIPVPVIYSAIRGVHKRMLKDLKRYTKFFAIENNAPKKAWAIKQFSQLMKKSHVTAKRMSKPITLELAKILCDTSYYGWLITYSQLTNMIAIKNKVNYDEMWEFSDEIHEMLGNRPKMFPGFIGGHCVIPNLELVDNEMLNIIQEMNLDYSKTLKKR